MPNVLGDSDNYIMANPMQTPPAIVPEWYLLPFYAILRSIPNKLLGVIAMFSAILAIMLLPITDLGKSKGFQFRPLNKIGFWFFFINFLILMVLGSYHVEEPYIPLGQLCTFIYFFHIIAIVPLLSMIENISLNFINYDDKVK
jgi:ubiquinol-cytochrome c reductase cytochrome b subunit